MKFDLRRPCAKCPFRKDIAGYLNAERAREIGYAITTQDATFSCHETNSYDDETDDAIETDKSQHCAGAMILLERIKKPNQLMRIAERLRWYDYKKLDIKFPHAFSTVAEFVAHHACGDCRHKIADKEPIWVSVEK